MNVLNKHLGLYKWDSLLLSSCLFVLFGLIAPLNAQPIIELETFVSNIDRPVAIVNAGDDRLFVLDQKGIINIVTADGQVVAEPFLDINSDVINIGGIGDEKGLLGLAFHPDYATNGYFFVNYTNNSGDTRVVRFSVDANDPNKADPNSDLTILSVSQPFGNHNGGDLAFGPDGYLYIGLGDGGAGGDPGNRSQNPQNLLGKMLRIDVDNGNPYAIPESNPFVGDASTADEIWALGLRNPWRYSFDRLTGDLYMGDVGQGDWEEISFQPGTSAGGENYGWRCREGFENFNTSSGCNDDFVKPIYAYPSTSSVGCSVTGGYVYRGSTYPDLYGKYIYGDYCSGRIWALYPNEAGTWENIELENGTNFDLSAFGEGNDGEIYVAGLSTNRIYKVTEICSALTVSGEITAESCDTEADGAINLTVNNGEETYTTSWSNGADTDAISALSGGEYTVTVAFSNGCERVASFNIPTGSVPGADFSDVDDLTLCDGESALIPAPQAPEGYGYQWLLNGEIIAGATEQNVALSAAGSYSLIYTSTNPEICDGQESDAFEVEIISPELELNFDNGTLTATAGFASYSWFLDGQEISDATGNTISATMDGDYTVIATDEFGCTATTGLVLVDTYEALGFSRLLVAPNPVKEVLHIEIDADAPGNAQIRILNINGQVFHESEARIDAGFVKDINVKSLPAGIYLLSINKEGKELVRKIIKN